jgi:hypothetical protein
MTQSNNVRAGTVELGAIAEGDDNPDEAIGFLMFSTTGDLLVDRDWLLQQWEEYELPQKLLPSETSNWQAYRRALSYVEEQSELMEYSVWSNEYNRKLDAELEIKKSNDLGSNVFLVYARTFFPEEICGREGGNWAETRIGRFNFHRPEDNDMPGNMITNREIDEEAAHHRQLQKLFNEAREMEHKMRKTHNFSDLQNILTTYRELTNAIEIRRAVYFIPAHHEDTLNSLSTVWSKMRQFKDGGEAIRIDRTPVVDMQEQRELVANRVEEQIENVVDRVVDDVLSEFREVEDQTADEAAREIAEQLSGSKDTASTYNQLLGIKLSVKEILEERRTDLREESEEVIQNVLDQQTFDEVA